MQKLASETLSTRPVTIGPVTVGGDRFVVMAGPCAIESPAQFADIAREVKAAGAVILRGGIYKLRTSPDSFQGLGRAVLGQARAIKDEMGLAFVSEVVDPRHIEHLHDVVDVFQVGTRNMFNYSLLTELGQTRKPVLLKRGFSARIEEWLLAADYLTKGGNDSVILCERGIRTFETATRNTLDLASVAWVKKHTRFPVVVDPSHATGDSDLVAAMSLASAAAGADGLLVEVHPDPAAALSDAQQSLDLDEFNAMMRTLQKILAVLDRPLHTLP